MCLHNCLGFMINCLIPFPAACSCLIQCYSREFIKEYSASHPESCGLKAVSLLVSQAKLVDNC
jgi:hypothetical protein